MAWKATVNLWVTFRPQHFDRISGLKATYTPPDLTPKEILPPKKTAKTTGFFYKKMGAALILVPFTGVVNCLEITPPSSESEEITSLLVNSSSKPTAMICASCAPVVGRIHAVNSFKE